MPGNASGAVGQVGVGVDDGPVDVLVVVVLVLDALDTELELSVVEELLVEAELASEVLVEEMEDVSVCDAEDVSLPDEDPLLVVVVSVAEDGSMNAARVGVATAGADVGLDAERPAKAKNEPLRIVFRETFHLTTALRL